MELGRAAVPVHVFRGPKRAGQLTASGPADKPDDVADRVAEAVAAFIRVAETK